MLELYHAGLTACSKKVRLCLKEKRLTYVSHYIDLGRFEHHRPEYLKLNPNGLVPTLVHDGAVIIESTVINEYLDDAFPDPPLRPTDALARARMRLWTKQLDEGVHLAIGTLTHCIAYRYQRLDWPKERWEAYLKNKPLAASRERSEERILKGIESKLFAPALARAEKMVGDMETALADGPWLAGDSFSLADIGFTPYILRLGHLQLAPMWDHCPRLADWYGRIQARPSFQKAAVDWFNDDAVNLMADKGKEEWPRIQAMLGKVPA